MKFQRGIDIRHSTDFVDIGGKPLIKKSLREESSFSNGLTDQWTDERFTRILVQRNLHWTFTKESI